MPSSDSRTDAQWSLIDRASAKFREDGLVSLAQAGAVYLYSSTIRPALPITGQYPDVRGITVGADHRRPRPFDELIGIRTSFPDDHKRANVELLQEYVGSGDDVVVVGGGNGITAVAAAKAAGKEGSIRIYEGTQREIETLQRTMALNDVRTPTIIQHAIVGDGGRLKGNAGDPDLVEPHELPSCDVLEMDCEGAEVEIIRGLSKRPATIVVETHPDRNASTAVVYTALERRGYRVVASKPDRIGGDVLVARDTTVSGW